MENKNDENLDNAPQPDPTAGTPSGPDLSGQSENDETPDPADTDDTDDSGAASDVDPESPAPPPGVSDGTADPTDGETSDNPGGGNGGEYGARFLNAGILADSTDPVKRRDSLAAILIRTALALLTGEIPPDTMIALTDAALAREEILKAHAETERMHAEIEKARAEGEIAGRNAVIEEQLVTPPVGAPDLGGAPLSRSRRAAATIFDLASLAR